MKNFIVFAGDWYYPDGGAEDFHIFYNTIEETRDYIKKLHVDWAHIADYDMRIIEYWERDKDGWVIKSLKK